MKNTLKLLAGICLIAFMSLNAIAKDGKGSKDSVKQAQADKALSYGQYRMVVTNFMVKNGDITKKEASALNKQHREVQQLLKASRESGDKKAHRAKAAEIRKMRENHRQELDAYVDKHKELAVEIEERKNKVSKAVKK